MIFDAHGDILTDMYEQAKKGVTNSFKKRHLDNYKLGNVTHSIFVNWTTPKGDNPELFTDIFEYGIKEINENSDIFRICYNTSDMKQSLEEEKIGVILGIEGIKNMKDVNHLHDLYKKGIRHATLTWNESNKFANGLDNESDGLTPLGFDVIKTMNELGMIVDLAHTNEHTFNDIITTSTTPVIISHGNAKALCGHRRNYTDDQLFKLKENNGVIGICAIMPFVGDDLKDQTVEYMAQHIKYVRDLIGIDHVGVGFDLCYYLNNDVDDNKMPGFKTMADAGNLFIELEKLGFTDSEIEQVKFKNFERIVKTILG